MSSKSGGLQPPASSATAPESASAMSPVMSPAMSPDDMRRNAEEAVALLKSVASHNRLMILCQLVGQERSVNQLASALAQSQSVVSQHLSLLRREGLVVGRRDAQSIHYRIADPRVGVLMDTLFQLFCAPAAVVDAGASTSTSTSANQ